MTTTQQKVKYTVSFEGRQAGAIGITYKITDAYKAANVHEVMSLLYEDYDLIRGLAIKRGSKIVEIPKNIVWIEVRSRRLRPTNEKGEYIVFQHGLKA